MNVFGFRRRRVVKNENHPFTAFVLRVDTSAVGWQKTLGKVLNNTKEVLNFRMNGDGTVEVSGAVDPVKLLKVLGKSGKKAQLVGWKFGECSTNLHMMPQGYSHYYGYGGNNNNYYGGNNFRYLYDNGGGGGGGHDYDYYGRNNHYHADDIYPRYWRSGHQRNPSSRPFQPFAAACGGRGPGYHTGHVHFHGPGHH